MNRPARLLVLGLVLFDALSAHAEETAMRDPVWAGVEAIQLTCKAPEGFPDLCARLSEQMKARSGVPVEVVSEHRHSAFLPARLIVDAEISVADTALVGRLDWRNGLPRKGVESATDETVRGTPSDPDSFVIALAATLTPEAN